MPTLTPSSEDTRIYELCLLYPYPIGQKEEHELLKEIDVLFTEAGARLVAKDKWGQRGLAYPIEGSKEGNYIIYYYDMLPAKVKEIDTQLRIMKNVLRHMFMIPPKNYQIVQYGETYEQWLKERESVTDKRDREKEEKVKEAVARKAKRTAKLVEEKKKEQKAAPAQAMSGEDLTQKLDKLISDDSVDL
jgi:ribosomal protein S6